MQVVDSKAHEQKLSRAALREPCRRKDISEQVILGEAQEFGVSQGLCRGGKGNGGGVGFDPAGAQVPGSVCPTGTRQEERTVSCSSRILEVCGGVGLSVTRIGPIDVLLDITMSVTSLTTQVPADVTVCITLTSFKVDKWPQGSRELSFLRSFQ